MENRVFPIRCSSGFGTTVRCQRYFEPFRWLHWFVKMQDPFQQQTLFARAWYCDCANFVTRQVQTSLSRVTCIFREFSYSRES